MRKAYRILISSINDDFEMLPTYLLEHSITKNHDKFIAVTQGPFNPSSADPSRAFQDNVPELPIHGDLKSDSSSSSYRHPKSPKQIPVVSIKGDMTRNRGVQEIKKYLDRSYEHTL